MGIWTTTSSTASTDVWLYWCGNETATATSSSTSIWYTWCTSGTTASSTVSAVYPNRYRAPEETPEQREARIAEQQRREEEYRERLRVEEERRKDAEAKAEKLLVENLSLRQREEFRKHKHFVVHGQSGRRYRIRHGRTANIDVIDLDGRITHRLCAHPAEQVPHPDTMLAQKFMLECDEDHFVRLANRHEHYGQPTPILPAMH